MRDWIPRSCFLACMAVLSSTSCVKAADSEARPWMNTRLDPDARASLVVQQMTRVEMLSLVEGWLGIPASAANAIPGLPPRLVSRQFSDIIGSAGYVPGIARLGIPALQESDASLGVANPLGVLRPDDVATALPSSLLLAASFDTQAAYRGGAMIGQEASRKGFDVLLAGGVDLARDPRNGRNFEYLGEDPLLAGMLAGESIRGIQDQHVIATAKHYVMNDQETNRNFANARIDEKAMRESDLLAFELAIEVGHPGSIMCAYNLINGQYACANSHLLNDVLKGDWHYPGWVMSDWGAVHSLDAAAAGLDQESAGLLDVPADLPAPFTKPLEDALTAGSVSAGRLTDMTHRILRSMFAVGVIDHPPVKSDIDYKADGELALHAAEEGIVLLKNEAGLLPLTGGIEHIAVIGGHADTGVLSGGGSSQVYPVGQPAPAVPVGGGTGPFAVLTTRMIFDPSSPLKALRTLAPHAQIRFDTGRYPSEAARLAKWADVVIVFATQWTMEEHDVPDLTLPEGQDQLIGAVAAANPRTIVVLESGDPVLMPWLDRVTAVVEAWYPGQRGGEAIANVLYGVVNPAGRLPITFPRDSTQNPRQEIPGIDNPAPESAPGVIKGVRFDVDYNEGSEVGYRWFAKNHITPLFSFGYGLSYTRFDYSNLKVAEGKTLSVSFDVANTGSVKGSAVPQIYLTSRAGQPLLRLIGFSRLSLSPGEKQQVSLSLDPRLLADFDVAHHRWSMPAGEYAVTVSRSASDNVQSVLVKLGARTLRP
jgi:beta-glucosidase